MENNTLFRRQRTAITARVPYYAILSVLEDYFQERELHLLHYDNAIHLMKGFCSASRIIINSQVSFYFLIVLSIYHPDFYRRDTLTCKGSYQDSIDFFHQQLINL